jgi:hypothetical protein
MKTKEINLIWQTQNGDQTTFEYDYTTEILFCDFNQNKIFDNGSLTTVLDNSVIIYSNNQSDVSEEFRNYLKKFVELNFNFYLLHFSNEGLSHNTNYYELANHVFRNYYDKNILQKNVTFIPLGVKSGFLNNSDKIENKIWDFAFIGQPKSDRNELLEVISNLDNVFTHKTNSWNCSTSLTQDECKLVYQKTKFVPCPMGWVHPDSFRIMECLESNSIPILKSYNDIDYFSKVWGDSPIPIISSWNELMSFYQMSDEEYNKLHSEVFSWYQNFKRSLKNKINDKIQQ